MTLDVPSPIDLRVMSDARRLSIKSAISCHSRMTGLGHATVGATASRTAARERIAWT